MVTEEKKTRPILVWAEWNDITSSIGWRSVRNIEPMILARTVGWLIEQTKTTLTLASTIDDDPKVRGCIDPIVIPLGCIQAWGELSVAWP